MGANAGRLESVGAHHWRRRVAAMRLRGAWERAMADEIDRIVEQTIANTLTILTTSQHKWSVAREGIEKIYDDLALRSPDHPALNRLKTFIAERVRPS